MEIDPHQLPPVGKVSGATRRKGGRGVGVLTVLCVAQFMLILDGAIVQVALPVVQKDLKIAQGDLQLVVTAYTLAFGGLLLLGGRLADLLGRRRVFVAGLALFTLASLACGLARSVAPLVIPRAFQGAGGALVSPAALALLIGTFPEGRERDRALGIWATVAAVGGAAGLLLGGVLTDLVGWRWVFFVNVPIGAITVAAAFRVLPKTQRVRGGRIDAIGAFAVTAGLIALVYGLGRGEQAGFSAPATLVLLVVAGALLGTFIAHERQAREPLVPFGLFALRTLTDANLATLLLSAVVLGGNYFLALYFQQVLAYSPLLAGLAFLPQTVVAGASASVASRLVHRTGTRPLLLVGMVALTGGAALLRRIVPNGDYVTDILPGLTLISVGLGIGFTVGTLAATAGVPDLQQGIASGILNTSQQVGGALGLAVLATVAGAATRHAVGTDAQTLTTGFRTAFLVASGFGLVATFVVWWLGSSNQQRVIPDEHVKSHHAVLGGGLTQVAPCLPSVARFTAGHDDAGQAGAR